MPRLELPSYDGSRFNAMRQIFRDIFVIVVAGALMVVVIAGVMAVAIWLLGIDLRAITN